MLITGTSLIVNVLAIEIGDPLNRAPRSIFIRSGESLEVNDDLRYAAPITDAKARGFITLSLEDQDESSQEDLVSSSGYSGKSGYSGTSGKSGFSGTSGYSGTFSGFSGISGQSGVSGFSGAGSAWTSTTAFNSTPPTTSTITTTSDLSGLFSAGTPIRYKQGGVFYYAVCTSINATTLAIAGPPLNTGAASLQELAFGSTGLGHGQVMQFFVGGRFGDAADSALLQNDSKLFSRWVLSTGYLAKFDIRAGIQDSGASQPNINVDLNGASVSTSNANAGIPVSTAWTGTAVDINTTNYKILNGQTIEVRTDNSGTNKDAENLSIILIFVLE